MDRKIKYVALYVRKSRDNKESLEGQLSSLVEYCNRFEWKYEVFSEEGSASSEEWNRPELQRMIALIEKQHFDAVLVTEQSRITRSDDFPKFRNVLQEANCLFMTTQTNSVYDYTKPEDEFVSDIMSAVAKQEIAFSKIRLKRGTIQSAKKGNYMGKKVAVGFQYNRETKRLELSDDAPIIQRLFQEYVDGLSTTDIAHKFTLENVTTSVGTIWTSAGISRLLNNPVYVGHSLYGRTTQKKVDGKRVTKRNKQDEWILIQNTHESLISQEMWDEVQRIKLQRNSRPLILKLGRHMFSGLIQCKLCGRIHSFQTTNRGKKRITSCQTRHHQDNSFTNYVLCPNKGGNLSDFEQLFFVVFGKRINELEQYIEIIKASENTNQDNSEEQIKIFERQLKKLDQDIKRVQQGFIMEIFSEEEAQTQIKGFKTQKATIEKELERLSVEVNNSSTDYLDKVLGRLKDFMTGHSNMPESEANEILREFVDRVVYQKLDNEMELKIIWK
jgi:site-specific DNA recombinase